MLKEAFKGRCRTSNALCHLCVARGDSENAAIDYRAKPQSPNAFEADHYHPVETHPQLAYEVSNLRASHSRCNRQRRDELVKDLGTQQVWVKPSWL